jgi:hypothetical protein
MLCEENVLRRISEAKRYVTNKLRNYMRAKNELYG